MTTPPAGQGSTVGPVIPTTGWTTWCRHIPSATRNKLDFLAATEHVERWCERNKDTRETISYKVKIFVWKQDYGRCVRRGRPVDEADVVPIPKLTLRVRRVCPKPYGLLVRRILTH